MATHSFHPDGHQYGLSDECERCAEHAKDPFRGLDDRMLRNLLTRVEKDLPARSTNEWEAMRNFGKALNISREIERIRALPKEG